MTIAQRMYEGLKAGGVSFAVYLPDSVLYETEQLLEADAEVSTVVCSREDEGVAIATGAALAGETAVALMEGSGLGLSGLVLARAQSQRTPLLVVFSHVRSHGDRFDYHSAARATGEGICIGLGIPYAVARDEESVANLIQQLMVTAASQKTIVGMAVPGNLRA